MKTLRILFLVTGCLASVHFVICVITVVACLVKPVGTASLVELVITTVSSLAATCLCFQAYEAFR